MAARVYLIAGKVTDSVTHGFLPALRGLGLPVTLLTDRVADHEAAYASVGRGLPTDFDIAACDVTDFRAIIAAVARRRQPPAAVFTNSDHLQAPVALAADFLGLPGKDWRAAVRTKDKALMREHLARSGRGVVAWTVLAPGDDPATAPEAVGAPFPYVVKPRTGVASEDVVKVTDRAELAARCHEIWLRRPSCDILVEEFLPGSLHTLETLGDGAGTAVLGSFHTTLSAPPHFIEQRLEWAPRQVLGVVDQVLAQLRTLGVGFGACHTEFIVDGGTARLVEVNYRVIGDHCDFLLADLLGIPIFEYVLRAHLGETLPRPFSPPSPSPVGHAVVESVVADSTGMLAAAPGPLDRRTPDGVRLTYRPMRAVGEWIAQTNTNRDYLGAVRAIGPDREGVEAALAWFRSAHRWDIVR